MPRQGGSSWKSSAWKAGTSCSAGSTSWPASPGSACSTTSTWSRRPSSRPAAAAQGAVRGRARITCLTGVLIVLTRLGHDGVPLSSGYMTLILTGGLMGTLMWYNVWFVIWPIQRRVIASANAVAGGGQADPDAAKLAPNAGLASRTNTMLSIPMLFFMGSASHFLGLYPAPERSVAPYWLGVAAHGPGLQRHPLMGNRRL